MSEIKKVEKWQDLNDGLPGESSDCQQDQYTIEQASSTPEKWNWNEFGFLSFILSLEQCGLQEIDKKNCNQKRSFYLNTHFDTNSKKLNFK